MLAALDPCLRAPSEVPAQARVALAQAHGPCGDLDLRWPKTADDAAAQRWQRNAAPFAVAVAVAVAVALALAVAVAVRARAQRALRAWQRLQA